MMDSSSFRKGIFSNTRCCSRGLLWGIGRLAEFRPEILRENGVAADLLPYLESDDHVVRGWQPGRWVAASPEAASAIADWTVNPSPILLYEEGHCGR